MLHKERFFPHNSEQIKNVNKNSYQRTDNSMKILQGHIDKLVMIMTYIKWLQKKNVRIVSLTLMRICQPETCCKHLLQSKTI